MKAVTIDQLRVFRQVAETGSFSAAARAMHRAQSAVTYAVQKLEDQAGVELFDRSGYRPVLSEAGRALLPRAVRILEELAAFVASGLMAFAYFIAHASQGNGLLPILNGGELAVLYSFLFLAISVVGGGAWSLDNALRKTRQAPLGSVEVSVVSAR